MNNRIGLLIIILLSGHLGLEAVGADCPPKEEFLLNDEPLNLSGWLAYSPNGMDVRIRNLSSGEDKQLYPIKSGFGPTTFGPLGSGFTVVDQNRIIIVAGGHGDNGLFLVQEKEILVLVQDKSSAIKFGSPVFFPSHQKLLYARREMNETGNWIAHLYEAMIEGDQFVEERFVAGPLDKIMGLDLQFLIQTSDSELLFKHQDVGYILYNLQTDRMEEVPILLEECWPVVWRKKKTKELICGQRGGWDLLDMDGNKRHIPGEAPYAINAYVPNDYLIGYNKFPTDGGCLGIQGVIYDFESEKSWSFPITITGRAHWYGAR